MYYWFEKFLGIKYNEQLAAIHFWLFVIGTLVTFTPMHFIGLGGQPRRIMDYPTAYAFWNDIASCGSFISFTSVIVFFMVLLEALILAKPAYIKVKRSTSLEWLSYDGSQDLHSYEESPIIR